MFLEEKKKSLTSLHWRGKYRVSLPPKLTVCGAGAIFPPSSFVDLGGVFGVVFHADRRRKGGRHA